MTVEGIRNYTVESKKELNRFIISIILSFLSFAIISMLISVIPLSVRRFSSGDVYPLESSNFFYQWILREIYFYESDYYFRELLPTTGYFLFTAIAFILFFISNSGILLYNYKRLKQLIFINWGFTIIPIITIITKISVMSIYVNIGFSDEVIDIATNLALYSLFYFPLQLILLLEKKTFMQFFGLDNNQILKKKEQNGRKGNFSIILIIYLSTLFLFLKSLFYSRFKYFELEVNHTITIVLSLLISLWFFVNLLIYLTKQHNMDINGFYGFLAGNIAIMLTLFFGMLIPGWVIMNYFSDPYGGGNFPRVLLPTAFFAGIILIATIPIGFLARSRRSMLIYTTISAALNLTWGVFIILMTFNYYYSTFGVKIFSIFICLLNIAIGYAGAFWGRFLGGKLFREKLEQENNTEVQEPNAS